MAGKITKPPPLPIEVFERVLRVARMDGKVLVILATTFAVFAALSRHAPPVVAGVLAAGCGLLELNGTNRLQNGDPQGLENMIMAQVILMLTVVGYAAWMLFYFDVQAFMDRLPPKVVEYYREQLLTSGFTEADIPRFYQGVNTLVYSLVAVMTVVFQGMMARFYQQARPAVNTVIFGPPSPSSQR